MTLPVFLALFAFLPVVLSQYSATYLPWTAPKKTEGDQLGTNQCGTDSSQNSTCQNLYVNSVDDFCLWAPPTPGANSGIAQIEVAWCTKPGYGTRLIPDGTLKGVHFVQTPDYIQITGIGDFTTMNVPKGDEGGELDPHGADGFGNPHGGLVFSSAWGSLHQVHEWTNFMSDSEFCIRVCKDGNTSKAEGLCQHIYDVMGCEWNMPGDYDQGVFEQCDGDSGLPIGVYGGSTFHQGDGNTPPPHPAAPSSNCNKVASVSNGNVEATFTTTGTGVRNSTSSAPTSSPTTVLNQTSFSTLVTVFSSGGTQTTFTSKVLIAPSTTARTTSSTTRSGGAMGSATASGSMHWILAGALIIFITNIF